MTKKYGVFGIKAGKDLNIKDGYRNLNFAVRGFSILDHSNITYFDFESDSQPTVFFRPLPGYWCAQHYVVHYGENRYRAYFLGFVEVFVFNRSVDHSEKYGVRLYNERGEPFFSTGDIPIPFLKMWYPPIPEKYSSKSTEQDDKRVRGNVYPTLKMPHENIAVNMPLTRGFAEPIQMIDVRHKPRTKIQHRSFGEIVYRDLVCLCTGSEVAVKTGDRNGYEWVHKKPNELGETKKYEQLKNHLILATRPVGVVTRPSHGWATNFNREYPMYHESEPNKMGAMNDVLKTSVTPALCIIDISNIP